MKVLNEEQDPLNCNRTRNEGNTYYGDYNCGGWALGTFSWFVPYRAPVERYHCLASTEVEEDLRNLLEDQFLWEDVEFLLNTFSNLTMINSLNDVSKDATVIAYRIGVFEDDYEEEWDYDFHFKVRRHGHWTEKCGGGAVKEVKEQDVFGDWINSVEGFYYSSELILFELKE